ncbi:hypothetical protein Dimus_035379, partial [Dionaea muscipula]
AATQGRSDHVEFMEKKKMTATSRESMSGRCRLKGNLSGWSSIRLTRSRISICDRWRGGGIVFKAANDRAFKSSNMASRGAWSAAAGSRWMRVRDGGELATRCSASRGDRQDVQRRTTMNDGAAAATFVMTSCVGGSASVMAMRRGSEAVRMSSGRQRRASAQGCISGDPQRRRPRRSPPSTTRENRRGGTRDRMREMRAGATRVLRATRLRHRSRRSAACVGQSIIAGYTATCRSGTRVR